MARSALNDFLESLIDQPIYVRVFSYPKMVQRTGTLKDFDESCILYFDDVEGMTVLPWSVVSVRRKK